MSKPIRTRIPWKIVLLVSFLGIAPTLILVVGLHRRMTSRAQAGLEEKVAVAVARVNGLLEKAERLLNRLVADFGDRPTPELARQLVRLVYDEPGFRESGLIDEKGNLVLTSLGPVVPPVPVPAQDRPDPAVHRLQVVTLAKTYVMKEWSIILGLPTQGLGSVNFLVDPRILTFFLEDPELGPTGYLAFLRKDGQVLARIGTVPGDFMTLAGAEANDRITARSSSANGQILVIASVDRDWALRHWWEDLLPTLGVAVIFNVLLVLAVVGFARRRVGLDHDLRLGIGRGEFVVYYQPIIRLSSGETVGVEALLRWRHPIHGMVRPELFIQVAEDTGQMVPLTRWLVDQVSQELAPWLRERPGFYVSLNVPPKLMVSGQLRDIVQAARGGPALAPDRLVIEITERELLLGPAEEVRAEMKRLRGLGVRFALDDFGAGYSSLGYLHQFEFNILKIDRVFLPGPSSERAPPAVLDTLIELGHKLGFLMVAEGVERAEQAAYLKERNVEFAQGWLYAHAMPAAELLRTAGLPERPSGIRLPWSRSP